MNINFYNKSESHPAYKNGKGRGYNYRLTKKLMKLVSTDCQLCHTNINIDVHHKDHNPKNNELSNLQVLCHKCHMLIHSKYFGMTQKQKNEFRELLRKKWLQDNSSKLKIPEGYVKGGEACKILDISRERLRQLKNLKLIETIKSDKKISFYKVESLLKRNQSN